MELAFWIGLGKKILGLLSKIPWQVWAVAALLLAGWLYGQHQLHVGIDETNAKWEAAQVKANKKAKDKELKRDKTSVQVAASTTQRAKQDSAKVHSETAAAVERVKYVTHTIRIPADCPILPASVQSEGDKAVERANAANRALRTRQH